MADYPQFTEPERRQRCRRRRRDLIDALQQSQSTPSIPVLNVGKRLREFRTAQGLSIRDLARKSGLNVNTLSMIENGKASPSLETLQQLSLVLTTPIAEFFEDGNPKDQIVYYKADQRPRVVFSHGMLEELGSGAACRGAVVALVTINPMSDSGENDIVHTGHEIVFCLEGQLTYTIEGQDHPLAPNDSLSFEAHRPHRWQNHAADPARCLLVLIPSDEQDRPTDRHFSPVLTRSESSYEK